MTTTTSCQSSIDAAEPLFATATEADIWICLEYRGQWEAKAFAASELPADIKADLSDALDAAPASRLQFIRKPGKTSRHLALYMARTHLSSPDAFRMDFEDYTDLKHLDFHALTAGTPPKEAAPVEIPWVLVCGNGRRDVCCAKHGTAVYRSLANRDDADVWLSNHQGGHRFAANAVVLPYGIHFGRMRPDLAPGVIKDCLGGLWNLDHARGHVAYPRPAQAAEHFLRQQTGQLGRDAFRLVSADELTDDRWRVRFDEVQTGIAHTLEILVGKSDFKVFKTSGDPSPASVPRYSLA